MVDTMDNRYENCSRNIPFVKRRCLVITGKSASSAFARLENEPGRSAGMGIPALRPTNPHSQITLAYPHYPSEPFYGKMHNK